MFGFSFCKTPYMLFFLTDANGKVVDYFDPSVE
jgi:hypothetical protein